MAWDGWESCRVWILRSDVQNAWIFRMHFRTPCFVVVHYSGARETHCQEGFVFSSSCKFFFASSCSKDSSLLLFAKKVNEVSNEVWVLKKFTCVLWTFVSVRLKVVPFYVVEHLYVHFFSYCFFFSSSEGFSLCMSGWTFCKIRNFELHWFFFGYWEWRSNENAHIGTQWVVMSSRGNRQSTL